MWAINHPCYFWKNLFARAIYLQHTKCSLKALQFHFLLVLRHVFGLFRKVCLWSFRMMMQLLLPLINTLLDVVLFFIINLSYGLILSFYQEPLCQLMEWLVVNFLHSSVTNLLMFDVLSANTKTLFNSLITLICSFTCLWKLLLIFGNFNLFARFHTSFSNSIIDFGVQFNVFKPKIPCVLSSLLFT